MNELQFNRKLASSICKRVLAAFHGGASNWNKYRGFETAYDRCARKATRMARSGVSREKTDAYHENVCIPQKPDVQKKVGELRKAYREQIQREYYDTDLQWTNEKQIELVVRMAEQKHVGNCREMAAKGYLLLRAEETVSVHVMSVTVPNMEDTHVFLVIGRSGGSDGEPKSWGPSAVVCDPWSQGFRKDPAFGAYPATKLDEKFKELFGGRVGGYLRPYQRTNREAQRRRRTHFSHAPEPAGAHLGWTLRR